MAQWYYTQAGAQQGPIDEEQLRGYLAAGWVGAGDLVWTDGMAAWQPAGGVPELVPAGSTYGPAYPRGQSQTLQYQSVATSRSPSQHAGLATTAMVLGICSFFVGHVLTGTAALICGWIALAGMRRTGNYEKKGQAIAGVVIGGFWIVLLVVVIIILVAVSMNK